MQADELKQIFLSAVDPLLYMQSVRANALWFRRVYEAMAHIPLSLNGPTFPPGTKALVLCEPWCADCVFALPAIARLAEASPGTEVRVASRDVYREAVEKMLGSGAARRVPTVLLISTDWQILGYWSERSQLDHGWMAEFTRCDPRPPITLESGLPTGDFAVWLDRRLTSQFTSFVTENWRSVGLELQALVQNPAHRRVTPADASC